MLPAFRRITHFNMPKICKKCAEEITGNDLVICRGYCGAMFHMNTTCSGVTRALAAYFAPNKKNLFWMCNACATIFENSHFRSLSNQADKNAPFSTLTTAINDLKNEIKNLAPKSAAPLTPLHWPLPGRNRTNKRLRGNDGQVRPVSDSQLGSKPIGENIVSVPTSTMPSAKEKFWLYISRIQPDVTVDAVMSMVKVNLETDDNPNVIMLIPKGMDTSTMNFISSKLASTLL